ncbi:hypothetical protein S616_20115 [Salmonella enterica subsp. enterica]|nr:hypothetical protein [Salmonella enterica subsp. enterica]
MGCRAFVIQHNAALRETGRRGGPQRVTRIMSAPGGVGALRGCISSGVRLAPAFGILARRGAKLRSAVSGGAYPQPRVAAIPGGSGAPLRPHHRVKGRSKGLSACGLRLKGFMPARLRLSAAARSRCAPCSFPP